MPNLDGVSATACIREIEPVIPIIAMTSNIRADDIDMYFRYGKVSNKITLCTLLTAIGMNDVLPKPFTKDGMLRAMEKHLAGFLKVKDSSTSDFSSQDGQMPRQNDHAQLPLAITLPALKEAASPGGSPATAASWNSPSQVPGPSPLGNAPANYMQPVRDPGMYGMSPLQPGFAAQSGIGGARPPAHRRVISDVSPLDDSPANKRQRMYEGYGPAS